MYVYGNYLGDHVDDTVIKTYVGLSTQDERDMYNKMYPIIFKEAYNNIIAQYVEAGYDPVRGRVESIGAKPMLNLIKQIPLIGSVLGMFGFGKPKAPPVPYREIRKMAKQLAAKEANKLIKEQKKEIITQMKESENIQKWNAIQQSRGHASFLTTPTNVTIEKGKLVTKPVGETKITPL